MFGLVSCSQTPAAADKPLIGEFPMGQQVRVGPFTYTVLESKWLASISPDPQARFPKNRYLILKLSITNSGTEENAFPLLTLQSSTGQENAEIIEGVSEVPGWFAPLSRNLKPGQTASGQVVFDVPLGGYKVKIPEPADVEAPKFALVDVPVQIE